MILRLLLNTLMIRMVFFEDINEYNANEKCKIFIAFDEMIAYMLSNKILRTLMREPFIRSRK